MPAAASSDASGALRRRTAAAWRWPARAPWRLLASDSLALRLFWPLFALWVGMGTITVWAVIDATGKAVHESFDQQLRDTSSALAGQIRWGAFGAELTLLPQTASLLKAGDPDPLRVAVVTNEGRLVAGQANLLRPPDLSPSLRGPYLYSTRIDGLPARAVALTVASGDLTGTATVIIVQTLAQREAVIRSVALRTIVPVVVFGAASLILLMLGLRRGLGPVQDLVGDLSRRSATDLRPLPVEGIPGEVLPMVERFNSLLAQINAAMDGQRRVVADAAHQLRTPVAGIRVLADELMRVETTPAGRPLVEALSASASRMSRLAEQLLAMARSESARLDQGVPFELRATLREGLEPLVRQAVRQGKEISLSAPDEAIVLVGHPLLISEAVVNLVDNAMRYGGWRIRIGITVFDQAALITVEDNGRGIPAAERMRIFEPFWRGTGAHASTDTAGVPDPLHYRGSGLGLALVRDVVRRHQGRIELLSRPVVDGTRLVIRLPRVSAA